MLLYMVRHGESEANHAGSHAGWGQVPLTQKGIEQARQVGEKIGHIAFDKVYSSDLRRSVQTCETALPGRDYELSALLREISVGRLSCKRFEDCRAEYGKAYDDSLEHQDFTPYGGENHAMLVGRVKEFLSQLEQLDAEIVAVFAHEGTLRTTFELTLQTPRLSRRVLCRNCCIGVFEFNDGLWRLNAWNI